MANRAFLRCRSSAVDHCCDLIGTPSGAGMRSIVNRSRSFDASASSDSLIIWAKSRCGQGTGQVPSPLTDGSKIFGAPATRQGPGRLF